MSVLTASTAASASSASSESCLPLTQQDRLFARFQPHRGAGDHEWWTYRSFYNAVLICPFWHPLRPNDTSVVEIGECALCGGELNSQKKFAVGGKNDAQAETPGASSGSSSSSTGRRGSSSSWAPAPAIVVDAAGEDAIPSPIGGGLGSFHDDREEAPVASSEGVFSERGRGSSTAGEDPPPRSEKTRESMTPVEEEEEGTPGLLLAGTGVRRRRRQQGPPGERTDDRPAPGDRLEDNKGDEADHDHYYPPDVHVDTACTITAAAPEWSPIPAEETNDPGTVQPSLGPSEDDLPAQRDPVHDPIPVQHPEVAPVAPPASEAMALHPTPEDASGIQKSDPPPPHAARWFHCPTCATTDENPHCLCPGCCRYLVYRHRLDATCTSLLLRVLIVVQETLRLLVYQDYFAVNLLPAEVRDLPLSYPPNATIDGLVMGGLPTDHGGRGRRRYRSTLHREMDQFAFSMRTAIRRWVAGIRSRTSGEEDTTNRSHRSPTGLPKREHTIITELAGVVLSQLARPDLHWRRADALGRLFCQFRVGGRRLRRRETVGVDAVAIDAWLGRRVVVWADAERVDHSLGGGSRVEAAIEDDGGVGPIVELSEGRSASAVEGAAGESSSQQTLGHEAHFSSAGGTSAPPTAEFTSRDEIFEDPEYLVPGGEQERESISPPPSWSPGLSDGVSVPVSSSPPSAPERPRPAQQEWSSSPPAPPPQHAIAGQSRAAGEAEPSQPPVISTSGADPSTIKNPPDDPPNNGPTTTTGGETDATDPACAICACEYEPTDCVVCVCTNNHRFHVECVRDWLLKQQTCPLCRVALEIPEDPAGDGQPGDSDEEDLVQVFRGLFHHEMQGYVGRRVG